MYVCICRAVTVSCIRSLAAAGVNSVDAIESACGAGGDCGTCRAEIVSLLQAGATPEPQSQAA